MGTIPLFLHFKIIHHLKKVSQPAEERKAAATIFISTTTETFIPSGRFFKKNIDLFFTENSSP